MNLFFTLPGTDKKVTAIRDVSHLFTFINIFQTLLK